MTTPETEAAKDRMEKIDRGRRQFFGASVPAAAGALMVATVSSPSAAKAGTTGVQAKEKGGLDREIVEPLPWQKAYGYVQGNVISGTHRTFYMAGQGPTSAHGELLHPDDMAGQVSVTLDNMEKALAGADMDWSNMISLNVFTTDIESFFEVYEDTLHKRVTVEGGAQFGGALLQISGFAFPGMMVEIVGTAISA